ncbi:MAG: hypothetical protein H2674_04870 [Limnospira indica BM01]|nr:CARDB domain-containing protein [Limnospira indica]QNH58658.1 MAG: hypothetical protein H2674_04870 [Limnospira indica BM01]
MFATSQLPNDDFSSSATLSGTSVNITSSNVNATKEPGEPNHAGLYGGSSVWWNWTAPDSGLVTIDTFGSNFDTILAAYTGSSLSNLTEIDSNDDTNGLQSQISFVVEPGTTYKIAVDGFGGASGDINLSLLLETSLLSNDDFANSTSLGGSYASVTSSNIGATKQPGEPNHAGNSGGSSLWWNWTAPGSGNVAINTGGSDFDTTLAAYTGSSISNLTEVASNDDSLWYGRQSEIIFDVIGGTNYNIAVDGYNGASGNINLELIYSETQGNNVDLIPGNFTLNTTQSNPGDSIQVTYSIMNTGSDDADSSEGGFWVDFYLSDDSSIDPGEDYLLGWTWVDPIPGNSSTGTLTKQISLPNTSDSFWSGDGEYTIGLIVDPFGFVIETNESNNTAVRNITIGTSTEQPYTSVPITINGTYEGIIGDFNGDGISDVLWYVPGPGQDYIWFFDEDGNYESQPFTLPSTAPTPPWSETLTETVSQIFSGMHPAPHLIISGISTKVATIPVVRLLLMAFTPPFLETSTARVLAISSGMHPEQHPTTSGLLMKMEPMKAVPSPSMVIISPSKVTSTVQVLPISSGMHPAPHPIISGLLMKMEPMKAVPSPSMVIISPFKVTSTVQVLPISSGMHPEQHPIISGLLMKMEPMTAVPSRSMVIISPFKVTSMVQV